jgi:hypothetical protein
MITEPERGAFADAGSRAPSHANGQCRPDVFTPEVKLRLSTVGRGDFERQGRRRDPARSDGSGCASFGTAGLSPDQPRLARAGVAPIFVKPTASLCFMRI